MSSLFDLEPALVGTTQIFRQTKFDLQTFDMLQQIKRQLNAHHDALLTNAEILRVLILSHPDVEPDLLSVAP